MSHELDLSSVRLRRVETDDGLFLDGCVLRGDARARDGLLERAFGRRVDFLLVHGTGGNFYHAGVLEAFAHAVALGGGTVWRVNTRGHDGIASIPGRRGSTPGGATHEAIADCVLDLRAWVAAVGAEAAGVVLFGHSMGGVKSICFAAKERPPAVAGIVAISPPRFCHAWWMQHPQADAFRKAWREAEALVAAGRGDALLPVAQPVPFVATAAGFLAKYGPADDYDIVRLLPQVACPVLALIGTKSVATSPAFDGLPDALCRLSETQPALTVETIEGANTSFTGCEGVPFERMTAWLHDLANRGHSAS